MKNKYIIIYGPTGVGKSDTAVQLALAHNGQIINGDVGQFYEPLTIGTAKPDWRNEPVPHHLFDLIATPHSYTVVEYRKLVLSKMEELWAQGVLPIIVGGSGFYLKSLFFPPQEFAQELVQECVQEVVDTAGNKSWEILYQQDPERAQKIDPQDKYRIERALELLASGQKPSACVPVYQAIDADLLLVWLERDRAELYDRINQRVQIMMNQGWLKETQQLIGTQWEQFLLDKKIIGYDLLLQFSTQADQPADQSLEHVIQTIAQKTRNYAKRQHTFWRMFKKMLAPYLQAPSQIVEISLSSQESYTALTKSVKNFLKN